MQALKAIYQGLVTKKASRSIPAIPQSDPGEDLDSLSDATGWGEWITGLLRPTIPLPANGEPWGGSLLASPLQWSFQDQELKYFFASSASYNSLTFDINTDLANFLKTSTVGGSQGDDARALRNFKREGGKLIMYHGWSDPAMTPLESVQVLPQSTDRQCLLRQRDRGAKVRAAVHGAGNASLRRRAGTQRLRHAISPRQLGDPVARRRTRSVAIHYSENDPTTFIDRSMPLCAFPETAHLVGGNVFVASSWKCF